MARPIYDPTAKIEQTGDEIVQNIQTMFDQNLEERRRKNKQAREALENVKAIKKELGNLGSDFVREEIDAVRKKMQEDIFKQKKNSNDFRVDLAALGEYRNEMERLENLATNTQQYDQAYEDFEQYLKENKKYIPSQEELRDEVLRRFTDREYLAENSPEEIQAEMYELAKENFNTTKYILDNVDIGMRTVSTNFADGSSMKEVKAEFMDYNEESGFWEPNEKFDSSITNLIAQAGFDPASFEEDEIQEIGDEIILAVNAQRFVEEADTLQREYMGLKNRELRDRIEERENEVNNPTPELDPENVIAEDLTTNDPDEIERRKRAFDAVNGVSGLQIEYINGKKLKEIVKEQNRNPLTEKYYKIKDTQNISENAEYIVINGKVANLDDKSASKGLAYAALNTAAKGKDSRLNNVYSNYIKDNYSSPNKKNTDDDPLNLGI